MNKMAATISLATITAFVSISPVDAKRSDRYQTYAAPAACNYNNDGRTTCANGVNTTVLPRERSTRRRAVASGNSRGVGGSTVRSKSGVVIRVASSAQSALQCIVDYVERAGVRIKYMRGYGAGTVRGSFHPSGRAIDINQIGRNVTRPVVPRQISNAAADQCGVVSGARWGYADNGHWNLIVHGKTSQEPWPRVLR